MSNEYLLLTGALRVFDDFSQSNCDNFIIGHDVNSPKLDLLRSNYNVLEIAGSGNDFSKSIKLMEWVHWNIVFTIPVLPEPNKTKILGGALFRMCLWYNADAGSPHGGRG